MTIASASTPGRGGLALRSHERGEARDEGHDAEPDREGAGRPEAEVEHPILEEGRGDVPRLAIVGDECAAGEEHTERQCRPRRPSRRASTCVGTRSCARRRHTSASTAAARTGNEHRELILRDQSEHAAADGSTSPARTDAQRQRVIRKQCERRGRICGRFLDEDRRVGERRREPRPGRGEERPARSDDEPREPVGGKTRLPP